MSIYHLQNNYYLMSVNLNIDVAPIASHSHTHPSQ
jgi:hypothetical protein